MSKSHNSDFDSPWQESLEVYFKSFMALLFPQSYAAIDWERGYNFLDKELMQIVKDAEIGRRRADKLIQVWLDDGKETWILVHVEVQSQKDLKFAERMFVYHYRIFDRYKLQVVSLAVLADEVKKWRPETFSYGLWGCDLQFNYPVIKLLDYQDKSSRPVAWNDNPFAIIIQAHLLVIENRKDPESLFEKKFELVKQLYSAGYTRQDILTLFKFIDWLISLPGSYEKLFWDNLEKYEKERKMPYVTSVERIGVEKGIQKGIQKGVQQGMQQGTQKALIRVLEKKFGSVPSDIKNNLQQADEEQLLSWVEQALTATTIGDVFGN